MGRHQPPPTPKRSPRGEEHGRAKLTSQQVAAIRASAEPAQAVAVRLGVSIWTIYAVRQGKHWRYEPSSAA